MKTTNNTVAIIKADVIGFTSKASTERRIYWTEYMHEYLVDLNRSKKLNSKFSITDGDALYGLVNDPSDALRIVLLLKTYLNINKNKSIKKGKNSVLFNLKFSIGIGKVDSLSGKNFAKFDGPAFWHAGRGLEEKGYFNIVTEKKDLDINFKLIMEMLGHITKTWSAAQAEVLHLLIKGHTQFEVAEILKTTQPNVSMQANRAGWPVIKNLLDWYKSTIKKHYGQ